MNSVYKIYFNIRRKVNQYIRIKYILPKLCKELKNSNFSIISSNCNGGIICHDLGVRFNSPTVNLWMSASDYIKFVSNLERYLNENIVEVKEANVTYPVGLLGGDIKLYFQHYDSFEVALEKWKNRRGRVNFNNIFLIMTDRDGCNYDIIKKFDNLPFKNKVIFTSKKYPDIKSSVYCDIYEADDCVGILSEFYKLSGKRIYENYFDYVGWLNGVDD